MIRIYIAAPFAEKQTAERLACYLDGHEGLEVVSGWHRLPGTTESADEGERLAALNENLRDISRADLLVALCHRGTGRATYGEIACAIVEGLPVVWTHGAEGQGRCIFDASRLVRRLAVDHATEGPLFAAIETEVRRVTAGRARSVEGLLAAAGVATCADLHDTMPPGPARS